LSPRASLLGSRNGNATSLARIGGAFSSRSRSRKTSSGFRSGSGSGGSSRHNSHISVSNASLALGRVRAHSQIQGIGGAPRSRIELVLGHMPSLSPPLAPCAWATRLTSMGVRERRVTRKAIRSACPSLAAPVACCNGALGCVPIRLRAIRTVVYFSLIVVLRRRRDCDVCVCEIS
jgi:hypothetical protein